MSSLSTDESSFRHAVAITPHNSTNFEFGLCSAIWVGGAGNVVAVLQDDTVVTFGAAVGSVIPIRAKRVNSTNTTATLLVALH